MVFLVILIASFLFQMFLPWWVMILISFATCGIIGKTAKIAFWQSFLSIFILWLSYALFKSLPNSNMLATRVAGMFGLNFWWLMPLITGLISGLAAGISGFCGYHFRKAMLTKPE